MTSRTCYPYILRISPCKLAHDSCLENKAMELGAKMLVSDRPGLYSSLWGPCYPTSGLWAAVSSSSEET